MPSIFFFFSIHEPIMLRRYNVFDLGQNSNYEDDERNCARICSLAKTCYVPALDVLLEKIKSLKGGFRFACHVSVPALTLFQQYTPEVVDRLQALAATGCVEFVAGAAHSLAFLYSKEEFSRQLDAYGAMMRRLFDKQPTAFCSTEMIYNNNFGEFLSSKGYKSMLCEGTDHVLGWRSPNFLYRAESAPDMTLFLRNRRLSRDLSLRFRDKSWDQWPLTADKYAAWCATSAANTDIVNIFTHMNVFGGMNGPETGIFDFLRKLPDEMLASGLKFVTTDDARAVLKTKDSLDVPHFLSWDDAGGDLNSWLGNDMQKDAVHFLYSLTERMLKIRDPQLLQDFTRLQTSDYLRWMSTKWFTKYMLNNSPFMNPQDAYITYMNILADLEMRLDNTIEKNSSKMPSKVTAQQDTSQSDNVDPVLLGKSKTTNIQAKQLVA